MKNTKNCEIVFPDYFDEYEWEVEAKGWITGIKIALEGRTSFATFYDRERLRQDVEDEVKLNNFMLLDKVIVVPKVNRKEIVSAIYSMIEKQEIDGLFSWSH